MANQGSELDRTRRFEALLAEWFRAEGHETFDDNGVMMLVVSDNEGWEEVFNLSALARYLAVEWVLETARNG